MLYVEIFSGKKHTFFNYFLNSLSLIFAYSLFLILLTQNTAYGQQISGKIIAFEPPSSLLDTSSLYNVSIDSSLSKGIAFWYSNARVSVLLSVQRIRYLLRLLWIPLVTFESVFLNGKNIT